MKNIVPLHPFPSGSSLSPAGKQVALVDDDPNILEALSDWLRMLGFAPLKFASAESLLADLQRPTSTLASNLAGAILDINLEGMNGVALAQQLRTIFPKIPLVLISALNAEEMGHLGPMPAMSTCLKKPFHLDALEDALFCWIH